MSFAKVSFGKVSALSLGMLCLGAGSAAAEVSPNVFYRAFVWNDFPAPAIGAERTPPTRFQENHRFDRSASGAIVAFPSASNTVTRTGVGTYRVRFPGLGVAGGMVHVSAYGGTHQCKVAAWNPSGADMIVSVACFDGQGPANGRFTVLLYKEGDSKPDSYGNGYLWADQASNAGCYAPHASYSFNARNGANRVCRLGAGEYEATLPALGRQHPQAKSGTVQVTAYGNDRARCFVRNWVESAGGVVARVGCQLDDGPVDARFTLSFLRDAGELALIHPAPTENFYVLANGNPPSAGYQSDSYGGSGATMERPPARPGIYVVHLPGVDHEFSTAQVTAYGSAAHCTVTGWVAEPAIFGTKLEVQCLSGPGGTPVSNARFTLLYVTDRLILF